MVAELDFTGGGRLSLRLDLSDDHCLRRQRSARGYGAETTSVAVRYYPTAHVFVTTHGHQYETKVDLYGGMFEEFNR